MAAGYASIPLQPPSYDYNPSPSLSSPALSPPAFSPYTGYSSHETLLQRSHNTSYSFPNPSPDIPAPNPSVVKQHRRRCIDFTTTLILLLVWGCLTSSCVILLFVSHAVSTPDSANGVAVTADEIIGSIVLSTPTILVGTVLNEVLVDRCWRRVVYSALGTKTAQAPNIRLSKNLRAANFEWIVFVRRLFQWRLSIQDLRSFSSYCLLRWGTAISIASVQLCVNWHEADSSITPSASETMYDVTKRYYWVFGPLALHAVSVFGTMLIWFIPPWRFFSDRYCDAGLLRKYQPYLQRVEGGSAAKYDAVAERLNPHSEKVKSLKRKNMPGVQFGAKMKGISLGLICMYIPPIVAWAAFRYAEPGDILKKGVYRFSLHFVFLAQNILYLLALDFVIWNLSLEGLSRGKSGKPNKNLRHLGYSSGIMLFYKVIRQRRPLRAAIFLWLFWLQACVFRCLTVFYTFCQSAFKYGTLEDRQTLYDPYFWIGWSLLSFGLVVPLFFVWLITPFQAPICEQDGWRWAKIAQNALTEPGYYGFRRGEAAWGLDVVPFDTCKGVTLL